MGRVVIVIAAILVIGGGIFVLPQSGHSAIGMLIQTGGQVDIERAGQKTAGKIADLLYPGDVIVVSAGNAVVIYCPSSERLTFSDRSTVELGAGGVKVLKGRGPSRLPAKCLLPRVALGAESLERVGAFRARGFPPLTQYLGGPVRSARPIFSWAPVKDATEYIVVVKDAERDVTVWETRTTSLTAAYPESSDPLKTGEYEWQVQARSGANILAQGRASFEVKPELESTKSPVTEPESDLTRGFELENGGYYAEAATLFRRIRDANPNDGRIVRHLAWLYWNAGLIEAFKEESGHLFQMNIEMK